MTTQPETAVGSEATPAAETSPADAFNDIASEMLGEDDEDQDEAPQGDEDEAPASDEDVDDDIVDEEPEDEAALPPIEPPVSLTAEEKETFKNLPREAQEFTARRIGELEKGFQTKAQEAAQKERVAMRQAAEYIAQVEGESAQRLSEYAKQLAVPEPDPALIATDPVAYAQQVRAHQYYTAQQQQVQREAEEARTRQAHYEGLLQQNAADEFQSRLSEALPEFFDATEGPKLREKLTATAQSLGFSEQEIHEANANAILALKQISDLKAKAEKYDALMKRQMERVRGGKNLPPVSKPGVAKGADQNRKAKGDAAWEVVKTAKSRSVRDEAAATWFEANGFM